MPFASSMRGHDAGAHDEYAVQPKENDVIKKKLLTATLAFAGISSAFAATDSSNVAHATLDNGLRVVVVRDALVPVVTTQVNYLAGSDEAPLDAPAPPMPLNT